VFRNDDNDEFKYSDKNWYSVNNMVPIAKIQNKEKNYGNDADFWQ